LISNWLTVLGIPQYISSELKILISLANLKLVKSL